MEQVKKTKISLNEIKKRQKRNYILWLFVLPAFLFILIFNYVPMYGVLIAFQDFVPGDEILSASTIWVGLANFQMFFEDYMFLTLLENTFLLCFWGFVIGFPLPVAIALMLNSMRNKQASRIIQIIYYIPHFISLVVMVGMLYLFFGQFGLVNNVLDVLGLSRYSFFLEEDAFRPLYIFSGVWQDFGWNAIIYLAALSGVDPQQHEAALIDGASRLRRVFAIDFPAIAGTVSILIILSIGNLISVGYEKVLLMQTDANVGKSEVIMTFVYKKGLTGYVMQGYSTAVGLFNSIINVILLVTANAVAKLFSKNTLF